MFNSVSYHDSFIFFALNIVPQLHCVDGVKVLQQINLGSNEIALYIIYYILYVEKVLLVMFSIHINPNGLSNICRNAASNLFRIFNMLHSCLHKLIITPHLSF